MKKSVTMILCLFFCILVSAQKEGQEFCNGLEEGSYFPLDIKKKKIFWSNTYYVESIVGKKERNGKEYIEFLQEWENGSKANMFMREENGIVYQYEECCNKDTVRYDADFKLNSSWSTVDSELTYTIVETNVTLKTKYCNYKNLVVIKAAFKEGAYFFYYQKGYGYVGAKVGDQLISMVSPE